jgi:hypothetical protein
LRRRWRAAPRVPDRQSSGHSGGRRYARLRRPVRIPSHIPAQRSCVERLQDGRGLWSEIHSSGRTSDRREFDLVLSLHGDSLLFSWQKINRRLIMAGGLRVATFYELPGILRNRVRVGDAKAHCPLEWFTPAVFRPSARWLRNRMARSLFLCRLARNGVLHIVDWVLVFDISLDRLRYRKVSKPFFVTAKYCRTSRSADHRHLYWVSH